MAGQIVEKGKNKWLVRLQSKRRDGSRGNVSQIVYGKRKDAEKVLAAWLRESSIGSLEKTPYLVNEWLDIFLADAKKRVREKTQQWYETLLREYVRPTLGSKRLSDLTSWDIKLLYDVLDARPQPLSPKTLKHIKATLSAALAQAVQFDFLTKNPCTGLALPGVERGTVNVLTPAQAQDFLAACRDHTNYGCVLAFALNTGLRPSEYLALRWSDLELPAQGAGLCRIQRGVTERRRAPDGEAGYIFADTKTPRGRRTVTFPSSLAHWLREHRLTQQARRLRAGAAWESLDLVFANRVGRPQAQKDLTRYGLRPILEVANLPRLRLYDLRHSHATLLLSAGENPKIVSERLGHASVSLTLDTYSHVLPDMQRETADKLERLLFGK